MKIRNRKPRVAIREIRDGRKADSIQYFGGGTQAGKSRTQRLALDWHHAALELGDLKIENVVLKGNLIFTDLETRLDLDFSERQKFCRSFTVRESLSTRVLLRVWAGEIPNTEEARFAEWDWLFREELSGLKQSIGEPQ